MSQEKSADLSSKHVHAATTATSTQSTTARARYEQSHPAKSRRGSHSGSSIWPYIDTRTMDESQAGGESTYSYNSTADLSAYFREINGRKFSSLDSAYMLPADETEFWRLDKQHTAFYMGLGELYPCPDLVEHVMAPREGETIEMVDLGCGTGTWALSMARRFPHVQVLGIDLAPVPLSPDLVTPNLRFEIDNIMQGLTHHAGRFDLVHMRCVGGGLPDYAQAITYAAQCLKPGGLLIIFDYDMLVCAKDMVSTRKMATPNQPDGSWVQRFFYEFRWAYAANGIPMFDELLDKGLWEHPLLDGCGAAGLHIPLGPWATSSEPAEAQRLQFSGILLRQNIKNALSSCQTVMKRNGIPQAILDQWVQKCEEELDTLKLHNWAYLRMLWGQRRRENASNPLSGSASASTKNPETKPEPSDLPLSTWEPHRQVRVYHTMEECQAARKKRLDTIGEVVQPLVLA